MDTKKFFLHASLALLIFLAPISVFTQMDTPAEPYGGRKLMREFICDEMVYPEQALKNKIEGTVNIRFTVMPDGEKINYSVMESVSPELDREACRICKLIMFYPAVKSMSYIIADVVIPIKFNIKKYNRNCKQKGFDMFESPDWPVDTNMLVYATKALKHAPLPVFDDPQMNFSLFIMENIKYPEIAYKQNISGKVTLSFVVETSGRISNIEIIQSLGGGCSEEAIHLLKQIKWKPGILNGMAVRSFMTASISFSLSDSSDHQYLPNNNNTTM
jgi:TonB family protein